MRGIKTPYALRPEHYTSLPIEHNTKFRLVSAQAAKKEGDISSVFVSLSGTAAHPLPPKFAQIKRDIIQRNGMQLLSSWRLLLDKLAIETEEISKKGPLSSLRSITRT